MDITRIVQVGYGYYPNPTPKKKKKKNHYVLKRQKHSLSNVKSSKLSELSSPHQIQAFKSQLSHNGEEVHGKEVVVFFVEGDEDGDSVGCDCREMKSPFFQRRGFFPLSERFAGSGNGDGGGSSRTKSRYSTLVRPADLSLISTMSPCCNGITLVAVVSALTFLQISDHVYNLLHGLSLFVCLLRKLCVLILLLDFVLTTEVELSFCLVE